MPTKQKNAHLFFLEPLFMCCLGGHDCRPPKEAITINLLFSSRDSPSEGEGGVQKAVEGSPRLPQPSLRAKFLLTRCRSMPILFSPSKPSISRTPHHPLLLLPKEPRDGGNADPRPHASVPRPGTLRRYAIPPVFVPCNVKTVTFLCSRERYDFVGT